MGDFCSTSNFRAFALDVLWIIQVPSKLIYQKIVIKGEVQKHPTLLNLLLLLKQLFEKILFEIEENKLTIKDACAKHNVKPSTFKTWKGKGGAPVDTVHKNGRGIFTTEQEAVIALIIRILNNRGQSTTVDEM